MKHNTKFKKWLLSRYGGTSISFAVQKFVAECKPTVSYNTAQKWVEGSKPREFHYDVLAPQFADCPLFAAKK